jgi:hypothetical protein
MLSSTVRLAVVSMSLLRQGYGMPCFQVSNAPTMPRLMRTRHASQSVERFVRFLNVVVVLDPGTGVSVTL